MIEKTIANTIAGKNGKMIIKNNAVKTERITYLNASWTFAIYNGITYCNYSTIYLL